MNMETITSAINWLSELTIPLPDLVLIMGAIAIVAFVKMDAARRQRQAVAQVADLYLSELTRANRNVHATEMKLSKAKSDLERQKRQSRRSTRRTIKEPALQH